MPRSVCLYVIILCLLLSGCGSISVSFVSNPNLPTTVTGTVIRVQVGTAKDVNGISIAVTTVTLNSSTISNSFTFCGDQFSQFPINSAVRVTFVSGFSCSTLNEVVLL
jgi:uncharacterized protein YceK